MLGFFPLLLMISWGLIWNYQQPEGHCPVKPWLGLPVVSLLTLGTINEVACLSSHCKQSGLSIASNSWVASPKSNCKVLSSWSSCNRALRMSETFKMEFRTQLGVTKPVPPHIYMHNHIVRVPPPTLNDQLRPNMELSVTQRSLPCQALAKASSC